MNRNRPVEVPPDLPDAALPDADWADAFEMTAGRRFGGMRELATATVGAMPRWARGLLWLRNVLVAPFGLKTNGHGDAPDPERRVGIFPVVEEHPDRIVLGLDDRHLDFRIVVTQRAQRFRVTTLVHRHNLAGRAYIASITPFHKVIVAAIMRRAA